jgi:hypothetical protein
MSTPVNDIDQLERLLFEVMVALVVRKLDGLDVIRSTLVAVEGAGLEMGVLRNSNEGKASLH